LDSLQAAVLRIKLRHLDAYAAARNAAAAAYDRAFSGIPGLTIPERSANSTHVFHQYTLKVAGGKREALRRHLEERGIPAMIYYPVPCHLQNAYKTARFAEGSLPITESITHEVLSLPMSTELDEQQLAHITSSVRSFFNA
jgi:dTDP-4-amino-4,6-dideoxygalactose transaminase